MRKRQHIKEKVERHSTFKFTRGLSYIASTLFMHVKLNYATAEIHPMSRLQILTSRRPCWCARILDSRALLFAHHQGGEQFAFALRGQ